MMARGVIPRRNSTNNTIMSAKDKRPKRTAHLAKSSVDIADHRELRVSEYFNYRKSCGAQKVKDVCGDINGEHRSKKSGDDH